jgi:hypothetical protein
MKVTTLQQPVQSIDPQGRVVSRSTLHLPGLGSHEFYFRYEEEDHDPQIERHVNHHLLAHLMTAMRVGGKLRVEGLVDKQLLRSLDGYMHYWVRWCPELFRLVEIEAEGWQEVQHNREPGLISCFSGGVDSWYSCLRAGEDLGVPMKSLMFMHGHDIALNKRDMYDQQALQYEKILRERSLRLLRIETNAQETAKKFQLNWGKVAHGIYLAAGMHVFSHRHTAGCFPSSDIASTLTYPWGSNPVTDPLLSSEEMTMHYHDCKVPKFQKILELVKHEDVTSSLRVCYQNHEQSTNCGRCGKCLQTVIKMHVAKPDSWRRAFPNVDSFEQALKLVRKTAIPAWVLQHLEYVHDHALRHCDADMAESVRALVEEKRLAAVSMRMKLRRIFYDLKVRIFTKNPKLVKGA